MKTLASAALFIVLGLLTAPPTTALAQTAEVTGALLRGLDKITARITTFEAPLEQETSFGTLRILAHTCRKRPPEETPEVAVFLEIEEERPGVEGRLPLFSGWMFASSPALSALEHPVYDVWVIDCSTDADDNDLPARLKSPGSDNATDKRE
ncbi:MAG: DUF2155 domain-containing protein [Alphaproteobacteria bacterium]|jgi:hypothetical protein|nr:DUF2155 domain-containing protein [Alphaproteobacteria bacterium]